MKTIYLFSLGVWLFTLQSCNYFRSTHPQADLAPADGTTGMTDKSILTFSAATDTSLHHLKKESSLIYTTGDLSMYTEKYTGDNNRTLYKIYTANGTISTTVKSYYFKNDSLILVKEQNKWLNEKGEVYKDIRTYLRNNVTFKMDSRTAGSAAALAILPYLNIQHAENKYPEEDYTGDIKSMNDAINGTDKFEMVFDNITTYPEAHYINLKGKRPDSYKASLLVHTKDGFIDSLLNFPALFKDQKLRLKWRVTEKEAVYVPVGETKTSASGLNK